VQGRNPIAPPCHDRLWAATGRLTINAKPANASDEFTRRRADDDRAALVVALKKSAEGDKNAFEEVYRRTSAKLFGVCLRIFPERQDAEEALQDAYITIWSKAATFDSSRASPITWLVTLTRNRAIDRMRSIRNRGLATLDEAAEIADPAPLAESVMLADEADGRLNYCINTLDSRDAECVRTSFLQGATYAELAARDGVPLGTVKSRVRRALLKLRECMSQ
jgi:RNA polymerase sigma-70 factor, ECF subfamily